MITIETNILKNLNIAQSIDNKAVDIYDKQRSNLFTWRGQFSPQLVENLIQSYGKNDDVLFDPFVGSGTLLLEAALLNLEAYGTELNPAAYGLASIYELTQIDSLLREESIVPIDELISSNINNSLNAKFDVSQYSDSVKTSLISALKKTNNASGKIILNALIIGLDFDQKKLDNKILISSWENLKSIIRELPYSNKKIKVQLGDARYTNLPDNYVNLIITSPPYINVFNYHQNYRKSVEAIGYNILEVAKSEIGSNRKFRGNRFLTVIQYSLDIYLVFKELKRICKPNAKVIFIVGRESSVRKTSFSNAKLLTQVANLVGFNLQGEQPRVFKNKFGKNIYEEILRFSIDNNIEIKPIEKAREIATNHLTQSLKNAPEESLSDLKDAIQKAKTVEPSNLYKSSI